MRYGRIDMMSSLRRLRYRHSHYSSLLSGPGRCRLSTLAPSSWSYPPSIKDVANDEITRLSSRPRRPLTLTDLLRHGRPPLSREALLESANFTLSLLPARLAYRIQALRNLPFIVVSNPHISKIYSNYVHSLSTLLPYQQRQISTLEEEEQFTDVMADLVKTHTNTISVLARGFLECRKYISNAEVTNFLEEHLRARIGTRLIAQQHIALHYASQALSSDNVKSAMTGQSSSPSNYIGVIDTALQPAKLIRTCEDFVAEICELKYGVRPRLVINGEPETTFAHVPVHLEYIMTELLKNTFRAVIETGNEREPIEVTIAAAPDVPDSHSTEEDSKPANKDHGASDAAVDFRIGKERGDDATKSDLFRSLNSSTQGITIRIRDRGGGISPELLSQIWSYSFTTYSDEDTSTSGSGSIDALNAISNSGVDSSSIAGLGYGLPLSRAYAEYFGGGIAVQSLWGWGTDLYLTLQGLGNVE